MTIDRRDEVSFALTPAVMVPRFGKLEELQIGRVRYLVAANGMFVEARSRGLHACTKIAAIDGVLPYGLAKPFARLAGGPIPAHFEQQFLELALNASPAEAAALLLYRGGKYELVMPTEQEAGVGRIKYSTRGIDPLDVVVDMHSHGPIGAFFSSQDDADDLANPCPCFNALVFGHLDQAEHAAAGRFVLNGWAAEDLFDIASHLADMEDE